MLIKLKLLSSAVAMGVAAIGLLPSGPSTPDVLTVAAGDEPASEAAEHAALLEAHSRALCAQGCSVDHMLAQTPR